MIRSSLKVSVALLAAMSLPAAFAAPKPPNDPAKDLLQDVRSLAAAAADNADNLKAHLAEAQCDSECHLTYLDALKDETNKMGKDIATLQRERDTLPDWEQHAIDRVFPMLQADAADISKEMAFYNENQNRTWDPEQIGVANDAEDQTGRIAAVLKNYLTSEKLREKQAAAQARIQTGD